MVRKTLDELGIEHNTDKATKYPHGGSVHGYTTIYDSILTPLRDEPIRLLEIGICMEGSSGGHSVRMWRDYFSKASLYTFDIVDMSKVISDVEFEGRAHFFQGDQGNRESMSAMYEAFGTKPFDVLLEDGSHTYKHQMISLGHLFKYVKSEGYYLLEDISIPNHPVCCIRNDETYRVLQNYKNTGKFESPHLLPEECEYLENNIKSIELIPDIQDAYCVAVIIKK